jgi:hypothetical protein
MAMLDRLLDALGTRIGQHIASSHPVDQDPGLVLPYAQVLRPGDVLLVEGNSKLSSAIKYLTQSTWSHAALYIGEVEGEPSLIEAEIGLGVIQVPLTKYAGFHLRICRPVGAAPEELAQVIGFVQARLGAQYDMRNLLDLLRWTFPNPPVPQHLRRRMIALGSGEPTRAICSSLIAEAFNQIGYPILPDPGSTGDSERQARRELAHIRHHSLYAPRDFDASPFFAVVKPTLELGAGARPAPGHCPRCGRELTTFEGALPLSEDQALGAR